MRDKKKEKKGIGREIRISMLMQELIELWLAVCQLRIEAGVVYMRGCCEVYFLEGPRDTRGCSRENGVEPHRERGVGRW